MAGAPALANKELAGHTSLTTTQRYMHLSPSAKSAAIELLNAEVRGDVGETKKSAGGHKENAPGTVLAPEFARDSSSARWATETFRSL
jgi:hypothetical protein